jgi:hypothetical protein
MTGPTIGTQEYAQSDPPLPAIGSSACAKRGPKSRAGLIAYPVVAPSDSPMAQTRHPTRNGVKPATAPVVRTSLEVTDPTRMTSTKVAAISLNRLKPNERMAGAVQNTASLAAGFSVAFQCGY